MATATLTYPRKTVCALSISELICKIREVTLAHCINLPEDWWEQSAEGLRTMLKAFYDAIDYDEEVALQGSLLHTLSFSDDDLRDHIFTMMEDEHTPSLRRTYAELTHLCRFDLERLAIHLFNAQHRLVL